MTITTGAKTLRLAGRVALVTGASRGIGAAVARRLAAEGAQLVLVARTIGGLEAVDDAIRAAGGRPATLIPLDLMELERVAGIGPAIHRAHGRLDIVIGNAGTLALTPIAASDPKAWHLAMTVNVLANARLIGSTDPLLRQSDAGRAVFVTDGAATGATTPFWGVYGASKAALEALVRAYAAEVVRPTLRVNLAAPGPVRTALRARAFPGEDPSGLREPDGVAGGILELVTPECRRHGETVAI